MIQKGKVVTMAYTLKDSKGKELDKADLKEPFSYLHGAGNIIPGLEKAVETMKVGDKKEVTVGPAEGYGNVEPGLKLTLNRSQFPKDFPIEAGIQFEASLDKGSQVFTIRGVKGDDVEVDGNHPLAGETLYFSVHLIEVREATKEELQHGHVHGPGGHSH